MSPKGSAVASRGVERSLLPSTTPPLLPCVPQTCASIGAECGASVDDDCGGELDCGACGTGFHCSGTLTCVEDTCVPRSCGSAGTECGMDVDDGCGNVLDCGLCETGFRCSSDHVCVTHPSNGVTVRSSIEYNGNLYEIVENMKTATEARTLCQARGAELVSIGDQDEFDFVARMADESGLLLDPRHGLVLMPGEFWIGLYTDTPSTDPSVIDWLDGSDTTLVSTAAKAWPWGRSQPNADGNYFAFGPGNLLYDRGPSKMFRFMCETNGFVP